MSQTTMESHSLTHIFGPKDRPEFSGEFSREFVTTNEAISHNGSPVAYDLSNFDTDANPCEVGYESF